MANFNPSRCTVEKALLTPFGGENSGAVDIALMIGGFTIRQSIESVSISGQIKVLDSIGLLENLPLRGEEKLELEIKAHDIDTVLRVVGQVYKISDVESSVETKKNTYTLHWITKTSFDSGTRRLIKAFNKKPASKIVKEIFQQYYSKVSEDSTSKTSGEELPENSKKYNLNKDPRRKLYIQETTDPMQLIIPDYSPSEAIGFVGARAHSSTQSKSSSFRFFETFDGYYFVTDEWLFKRGAINKVEDFVYSPYTGQDATDAEQQVKSLISFSNPRRADVASELYNGAYNNSVLEIDILRHKAKRYNYSYLSSSNYTFDTATGKKANYKVDVHTEEFAKSIFNDENAKRFMIVRDYRTNFDGKSFKDDTNFREIAAKRMMYHQHMKATQVSASTRGRLDLKAGDVINVKVLEQNVGKQRENNKQLSGRYLITEVAHVVSENVLTTSLSLFKYDWSDAGIDPEGGL